MDYFKKEPNIYFSSEIQLPHVFFGYLPKKTKNLIRNALFNLFSLNKTVTGS
jgi:hypothetical protein